MREVSSNFFRKIQGLFMKEVRYICNLCKDEDDPKYLFGVKYIKTEGDVHRLEFTKELEVDVHLCTSCICSITSANNKGAFNDH